MSDDNCTCDQTFHWRHSGERAEVSCPEHGEPDQSGEWDTVRTAVLLEHIADRVEQDEEGVVGDSVTLTPGMARWIASHLRDHHRHGQRLTKAFHTFQNQLGEDPGPPELSDAVHTVEAIAFELTDSTGGQDE